MKILVLYFSQTGNTKKVADAIATACKADIEQIRECKGRAGLLGTLRTAYQTLFSRCSQIRQVNSDPAQYDLLILGTPVWMMKLTPPIRTYIRRKRDRFNNVAFFCTEGASGGTGVFKTMETLCAKQPITTLGITETELKSNLCTKKLVAFIDTITSRIK